jgi:uncharacterized protein YutE (UPF0331/DUF86 family)
MTDYPTDSTKAENHSANNNLSQLIDRRDALIEVIEDAKERQDSTEETLNLFNLESMIFLEFFTVSHALIESQSIFLLKTEMINREYYDHEVTEQLIERFPTQKKRESFLHDCGLIGDGLKGEMKKIRQLRNDLVHNYDERQTIDNPHQVKNKANAAIRTLERLEEKIEDRIQEPDPER